MKAQPSYRSPLRERQAAATRHLIVSACASLMENGQDLTYGAVAVAAGVQERTVYRHFPTKADLEAALWRWITERHTRADFTPGDEEALVAALRRSFGGFDAAAPLIKGMLHSRQGLRIRRAQQPARREMFERCVASSWPDAPADVRVRASAALQLLYSAPAWELLHDFWGMDAVAAADTAEFAIRALFQGLRDGAEGTSRRNER